MSETDKQFEFRLDAAKRAHDRANEYRKLTTNQIQAFSVEAMKAPALVAAGGIAAALGFYSANYSRLSQNPQHLANFNSILLWLFLGLLSTMAAPAFAYLSQLAYAEEGGKEKHDYEHPFVHETPQSRRYRIAGHCLRLVAVGFWLAAMGCLIRGGYLFLRIVA
ncbi:hypothetical protein EOB36_25495 [Mesorhizobium sp. M6A.T.Cr.TU.017.01.1.1]|uniref:hypothetical protein n=1 Tax=Mesorhizobium sp. M6A.T.Cr.TU.017.01.1.1 TaxID=2496774 RepID=UPI000FD4DEB3|nr:hypothetical protein [Mesorhizobium sp. M6A.T.Cr.TU.017.01.1.1]RUU97859.1 hypothetical protein EOB36_25495 [Mesorhizobium sp. M6A.T.Cr.TU.017.01.1.1]